MRLARIAIAAAPLALLGCSIVSDFDGLTGRFCDRHRGARLCLDFDGESDASTEELPSQLTLDRELFTSPPAAAKVVLTAATGESAKCNYAMIERLFNAAKRVVTVEFDVRVGDSAGKKLPDTYFVAVERGCLILFGGDGEMPVLQVQKTTSSAVATRTSKLGAWSHVRVTYEGGAKPALEILVDGTTAVARTELAASCAGDELKVSFGHFCYDRNEGSSEVRLDNILVVDSD